MINLKEIEKVFSWIEEKELQNFYDAVKAGQILTPTAHRRLAELQRKLSPQHVDEQYRWATTLADMTLFFGLQPITMKHRIAIDGFPPDAKLSHGMYDLKKVYDWSLSHFYGDQSDTTLGAERLRELKAKADLKEMERDERSKKLINTDKVVDDLSLVLSGLKQRLMSWYKTLPPHLVCREERELGQALRFEVRAILEDLAIGIASITPKKRKKRSTKKKKQKVVNAK